MLLIQGFHNQVLPSARICLSSIAQPRCACSDAVKGEKEDQGVERRSNNHGQKLCGHVCCLALLSFCLLLQCISEATLLCCSFPAIYVLKYQNMRNDKFKELREELRDSSK